MYVESASLWELVNLTLSVYIAPVESARRRRSASSKKLIYYYSIKFKCFYVFEGTRAHAVDLCSLLRPPLPLPKLHRYWKIDVLLIFVFLLHSSRGVDSHLSADPLFVSTRTHTRTRLVFVAFGVDSSSPSPSRVD